jgi:superfamily II DNA or RNA helicase
MVDECHVAPSRTSYRTLAKFTNAFYRIGLSGTPLDRGDKRSIVAVGCLGPILHRVRPHELFDNGSLHKPTIRLLPCKQKAAPGSSWNDAYDDLVVTSEKRNGLVVDAMARSSYPGMVFVQRKAHGKTLATMAAKAGLNVKFVHGEADAWQRQKAVKDLERAKIDYIICTDVFTEGVNIPSLRTVILAGGGKSVIRVLQQVGRVTRTDDGKEQATVYDIDDTGCTWLRSHSRKRQEACRREGFDVIPD